MIELVHTQVNQSESSFGPNLNAEQSHATEAIDFPTVWSILFPAALTHMQ